MFSYSDVISSSIWVKRVCHLGSRVVVELLVAGVLWLPYVGWGQTVSTSCSSESPTSLKTGTIFHADGLTLKVLEEGKSVLLVGVNQLWTLEDGAVRLVPPGLKEDDKGLQWIMPTEIQSLSVVAIGNYMGRDIDGLPFYKIVLPEKLEEIGFESFAECLFNRVVLPEGLKHIGGWAFAGARIGQINFPSTLNTISDRAFAETRFDCDITLPESLVKPGNGMFWRSNFQFHCISLPYSMKSLPHGCFARATNILRLYCPGVIEVSNGSLTNLQVDTPTGKVVSIFFSQPRVSFTSSSLGLHPDSIENGSSLRLVFPEGTNVSFEKDFLDIPETPVEVYRGKHIEYWDAQKNDWIVGPLPSPKKGKQFSN